MTDSSGSAPRQAQITRRLERAASGQALGDVQGLEDDYARVVEGRTEEFRNDPEGFGNLQLFLAEYLYDAGRHAEGDSVVALVRTSAAAAGDFGDGALERLRALEHRGNSLRTSR